MLPKPRPRRWKPEEHRAFHAAPLWALESQAERLLVQLVNRAHLAGVVVEDELPVALLEVRIPRRMLEDLVTFAIEREDLEPETDQGADDDPAGDDINGLPQDESGEEVSGLVPPDPAVAIFEKASAATAPIDGSERLADARRGGPIRKEAR